MNLREEFEAFAKAMVKRYGFCNWQCEDAWQAAYAAGMTRAAEICSQMKYDGYTPPEHGAAAEYYQDGVGDCADAIRAEITKEQVLQGDDDD